MSNFTGVESNQPIPHEPLLKGGEHKKQKIIKWDEETIAEHDKERGTRYVMFYKLLLTHFPLKNIFFFLLRQKIDEAPTPYRYLSESDQSEAESGSDGEFLLKAKSSNEKYGQSILFDSWEEVNAKLHYEKHLRSNEDETEHQVYSDFGENISPSSSFPKPSLRKTTSYDTEEIIPVASPTSRTYKRNNKSVHISPAAGPPAVSTNDHLFAGINGSISGGCGDMNTSVSTPDNNVELHREEFKNKRAGHYNEFKMLQAMREKLAVDEDDDEND